MPSAQAQFKEEVTQAHRTALQALHDILADTAAPVETDDDDEYKPALTEPQRLTLRLRAAAAILRVKSPDDDEADEVDENAEGDESSAPSPAKAGRADGATHHEPEGNQHGLQDRHQPPLAPQASRLAPKRRRPLTPAEIKAAKAKATFDHIARTNEAAYQDLLALRAKAQRDREAAAAAAPAGNSDGTAPSSTNLAAIFS